MPRRGAGLVKVAAVNCGKEQELCKSMNLNRFPEFLVYPFGHKKGDKPLDYTWTGTVPTLRLLLASCSASGRVGAVRSGAGRGGAGSCEGAGRAPVLRSGKKESWRGRQR